MRVYEAILEYLRLRTNSGRRDVEKMMLVNAHIFVDGLSDDELKQECSVDDPTAFLQENLGSSAEELITGLTGIDGDQRVDLLDSEEQVSKLPKNCSIPFSFAIDGRVEEAADLMRFLLDRGVASEEAGGDLFEEYDENFGSDISQYSQRASEEDLVIRSIEQPSDPVQAVIGGVAKWADGSFNGRKLLQLEVPVGATRIAAPGNSELDINRWVGEVFQQNKIESLAFEREIAQKAGARTSAGCIKADFVLMMEDAVYVGEVKSDRERITGQQDFYKPLGQALEYATRFSEDYPTIASKIDVYPVIATGNLGVDVEDIKPSLQSHGVGLFSAPELGWLVRPSGEFKPPRRTFMNESGDFPS